MSRKRLLEFSTELVRLRIAKLLSHPVEYHLPQGETTDEAQFRNWALEIDSVLSLRPRVQRDRIVIDAVVLGENEIAAYRRRVEAFQQGFANLVAQRSRGDVRVVIEGGAVKLTLEEFIAWMEQLDLGDLGWVGGDWLAEDDTPLFVMRADVPHLDERLKARSPTLFDRIVLSLLGPLWKRGNWRRRLGL